MDISELRFLIVEDQGVQRFVLVDVLESLGARHVLAAEDGRAALGLLREGESPVDVIISDLDMPGMDGLELIRHLGEGGGDYSLIVASALDQGIVSSVEAMAHSYGVRLLGALEKPVCPERLRALIERHAGAARQAAAARSYTEEEVLEGLAADQFVPYFQPKVHMRSGTVRGAEALARWIHPVEGIVGAVDFIPVLERSGRIGEFTATMVSRAAAASRRWRDSGFDVGVSINLSPASLADVRIGHAMVQLVRAEGLWPRDVTFEVTESTMASNVAHALENLSRLRMRGFGLSIDDYGTGYSSLARLTRVAFTELKIDQAFVRHAGLHRASRAMLESSLEMAAKLRIQAVAEGIETPEEWELLRELGCDLAQGYYLARPMDADAFLGWLEVAGRRP
jgi:EAL domain-containing protein (putative c-di-GMP-specific phosphodiesterase class I)/CheY-like chemotaxis protein